DNAINGLSNHAPFFTKSACFPWTSLPVTLARQTFQLQVIEHLPIEKDRCKPIEECRGSDA
ncbi:hypothetical protein, partial [Xanthomonas vasicola]|uniref:hypothetical protein n=1 Tax=Xanthomonas vasicola TaxID=56459 RepID=UPI001C830C46